MALRVEDIVVSEKNVYVLSGGRQFVADVEKGSNLTTSETSVSRNPWNLYLEDGSILCNLFDSGGFEIRSQITTGSSGSSKDDSTRHERMFMPNCGGYVGQCQLYGNAYSVSERTTGTFDAEYRTDVTGNTGTYSADYGFCRYLPASAYADGHFDYISPTDVYTPSEGINYIFEYPVNGFYSDFGNDYTDGTPTIFADAIVTKYYLDHLFSVDGTAVGGRGIRARKMRDYLGIGSAGDSVYLTFRNDRIGSYDSDGDGDGGAAASREYAFRTLDICTLGCLDNIVTCPCTAEGFAFSDSLNSDFAESSDVDLLGAYRSVQPKDNSFILYLVADGGKADRLVYIPKTGSVGSYEEWKFSVQEDAWGVEFVETESSVFVATKSNGLLNVFPKSHYYAFGMTDEKIYPFERPGFGHPYRELSDVLNGCTDFRAFYDGKGVLGVKCRAKGSSKSMAFVSRAFSTNRRDYEIGEYFQMLVHDGGDGLFVRRFVDAGITDRETVRSAFKSRILEETHTASAAAGGTATISTDCVKATVKVNRAFYDTISLETVLSKASPTYSHSDSNVTVSVSANLDGNYDIYSSNNVELALDIVPNVVTTGELVPQYAVSDILFDYSSSDAFDVRVGDYVLVQMEGRGLMKVHSDDLMSEDGYALLTDCGPSNRVASDSEICIDARFSAVSYDDATRDASISMSKYMGSDFESRRVTVKPAMRATYAIVDGGRVRGYEQSFAVFPLTGRAESVEEVIYGDSTVKDVETRPVSSFDFAMGQSVPDSMGVAVKTVNSGTSKHDAAISLVHWNDKDGVFETDADYSDESQSVGGLYLQYGGICTDVVINGYADTGSGASERSRDRFVSVMSEYPHPCFGHLVTAGTGLRIFDGPLADSMTVGDIVEVNGYVVVKNYETASVDPTPLDRYDEAVAKSGKTHVGGAHPFLHGGYVVTNFFSDLNNANTVKGLYGVEQVVDRSVTIGDSAGKVNNYNCLWHIRPESPIEFYPKSERGKVWKPYYAGKYVDFVKYRSGRYYIGLRNEREIGETMVGYDVVETDDLFTEAKPKALSEGVYVSGIRFFDDDAVVEYSRYSGGRTERFALKSFKYGKADAKFEVGGIPAEGSVSPSETGEETQRHPLSVKKAVSSGGVADYDNVEVLYSLNRFTPVVSHKSNLFSVKIEDLGLDESPFLSDAQKKSVKIWIRNKVMDIVDAIKPAHTEVFDVFVN